jgi:hypothetical protein
MLFSTAVRVTSSLGKFEAFLRPSLGGILSTGHVTVPARPIPELEGDHDSAVDCFDYWFVGRYCAPLVSGGIQPGSQRKAQSERVLGANRKKRSGRAKEIEPNGHPVSQSCFIAAANRRCPIPKPQFREPTHACWFCDAAFVECWFPFHQHDLKKEVFEG